MPLCSFNDTPTTDIYTLSLHDALPICDSTYRSSSERANRLPECDLTGMTCPCACRRSEEHTSELQSRGHLVCRLLLEKKKQRTKLPREPPRAERDTEREEQ